MKKVNFRSFLMTFLIVTSFASYIFLNVVHFKNVEATALQSKNIKTENEEVRVFMPDVELVKKIVTITKAVLHPFAE